MKPFFLILISFLFAASVYSQSFKYDVVLEPISINGLTGLQSYSYGQSDGKWLLVGGRLDGLHQRQPFASFSLLGHNENLIVVDPINSQIWSASLSSLSTALVEHLRTTNAEFIQDGDYLYIFGGYGYSAGVGDHKTFDNLTIIDVSGLITAIINGSSITAFFHQVSDARFAVTGGRIAKLYDTFYLVGGHKFDGRYNPMGNPTFTQTYTNEIRKFKISYDGTTLNINHLPYIYDAANLHRRDYNVAPQIMPNGQEGMTAFSGVFQVGVDLPFLNSVNIDSNGHAVNNSFSQYYNHYECAFLPVYSESDNIMTTVFFGGIARYYDLGGVLTANDSVPFVKTIARVSRNSVGVMTEYKMPVEMPALLGAGSHFIHNEELAYFSNGVLKLDSLDSDTSFIGYIYGGIESSKPNIFFVNTGTQSMATPKIFKVKLVKNPTASNGKENFQSTTGLQMQVYPNPVTENRLTISFYLKQSSDVNIELYDISGRRLFSSKSLFSQGNNKFDIETLNGLPKGVYLVNISTLNISQTQKIILN